MFFTFKSRIRTVSTLSRKTLQRCLNIGLGYQCCHDPLSLRQLAIANSWTPCFDTRKQQIYIRFVLAACWGVSMLLSGACVLFPQTQPLQDLMESEFGEETDLEAEPTWPSWLGNDSKLWSFFTASCRDKHKWLSSYCFKRSNTSFANVDKIICSIEHSGLRGFCSLNTLCSQMTVL